MPNASRHLIAVCIATTICGFTPGLAAAAGSPPSGIVLAAEDGVVVQDAWARASPGAATNGAAYITMTGGARADDLVGVSTPAAGSAQVHETTSDNGVMKMRPAAKVSISPHQTVTFSPGGYHIMLMDLKQPLVAGRSFPLTLQFAHAAPVTVNVKVQPLGRAAAGEDHGTMQMH